MSQYKPDSTPLVSPHEALGDQEKSDLFELPSAAIEKDSLSNNDSDLRRHGFYIGNIGLLLPPEMISEVAENAIVRRLPNSMPSLVGMTNLRGNMVPVFDIAVALDILPDNANDTKSDRKLLFLQLDDEWVGLYSNGLPIRLVLDTNNRMDTIPPVPEIIKPFVYHSYKQEEVWLDFDIKGFFERISERL